MEGSSVSLQGIQAAKLAPTQSTVVGLLPTVHPQVSGEVLVSLEGLAAVGPGATVLLGLDGRIHLQTTFLLAASGHLRV